MRDAIRAHAAQAQAALGGLDGLAHAAVERAGPLIGRLAADFAGRRGELPRRPVEDDEVVARVSRVQLIDDGVRALLCEAGFECAYEACRAPGMNNFGGRAAPPLTHWTGTTVDFAYVRGTGYKLAGSWVRYTPLSDHLPVAFDLVTC